MTIHDAVVEVVWWPANIIEMKMPVTWSALNRGVPSSSRIESSTSRRSRSSSGGGSVARRPSMIPCTRRTSSARDCVAAAEALDRRVGVDVGDRVGPALEVVVEVGEAVVELRPEPLADQARGRGVDGELGEEVEQVDLSFVAPVRRPSARPRSAMVAAWPRMNLSRSAWLWSISRRRSGGASKTTPSPNTGVMKG